MILIYLLIGTLLLVANDIFIGRNAICEDNILGKETLARTDNYHSKEQDVLERFEEIVKKYKPIDINSNTSTEDLKKSIADLNVLRKYIIENGRGERIISNIDQILDKITYRIRLREYKKKKYKSFSPLKNIKDQILNSNQILSVSSIRTMSQKASHTQELRKRIFELMGYSSKKTPLNSRTVKKVDCGKYIMEKVIFDSEPGVSVPGYLLIPKNISLPAPAIIALHQHAGEYRFGANEVIGIAGNDPQQFYAKELAERGYITFAIDARCFSERIEESEGVVDYFGRWIGKSLLGMIIWDDIRSVDYLLTRKEIDPNRIGCIGHSMGGTRATYLTALDDRIKVVVISCYVTSYKSLIEKNDNSFCPPSTWLPGILKYADCQDVLSLITPRPLLIINGEKDESVPIEGMLETFNSLRNMYAIFKAENKLKKIIFEGNHGFPQDIHEETYQWFDKWL